MNKQQLASKIWESANKMRSKIEANEYKDYILGFIFYKFLSEKEVSFLLEYDFDKANLKEVTEEDEEIKIFIQTNLGYFISYDNLFSTWIEKGQDFNISNVTDALSSFDRLIHKNYRKVFENILATLRQGLSKLGDSTATRTTAVRDLINLINDIPMDGKQDYDVLGFIYEYLISMFAANAGKKAGEFYTPHEVSVLMSEIVADHLKDKKEIKIYDPTSGSGSLLINMGKSVSRYLGNDDSIKYYAQELKENTYNLTRMNLVMKGIKPDNILVRNGDTLEDDWPYFDDSDPENTYEPLYVNAVVSNPPYSQKWDPSGKEEDPRYSGFGMAPKAKADYAFLLHDLYHLQPDGIMTIVLPHGVLFRGAGEGEIRKNLIEGNYIDAVIGLPSNIFFGTGIPTIIMILKPQRENTDILIVDASSGFEKSGTKNRLRASDIRRITDAVIHRQDIEKYSRKVSRDEIRRNEYNLNIPRYVDSSEPEESWDIYATMFGGIPMAELDQLDSFWQTFPSLKGEILTDLEAPYTSFATNDIKQAVLQNKDVKQFEEDFKNRFENFDTHLHERLIGRYDQVQIAQEEAKLAQEIFDRMNGKPLIDEYEAYQILDDQWSLIAGDLEILQSEGFDAVNKVEPKMVTKKKKDGEVEVQDGWLGHLLPFDLVQSTLLKEESNHLKSMEDRLNEIASEYTELIESMPQEEAEEVTNDDNSAFVEKKVKEKLASIFEDMETEQTKVLQDYLEIRTKKNKLVFIQSHPEINWSEMETAKDGTFSKKTVTSYIQRLLQEYELDPESLEYKIKMADELMTEEKSLKDAVKQENRELDNKTKETIESLADEQAIELLHKKWIAPLMESLNQLPVMVVENLINKVEAIRKKYETTLCDVEEQIQETESSLAGMLDLLEGNEFDMKGLSELKKLIQG